MNTDCYFLSILFLIKKNRECFKIARLYHGVKEFDTAKSYLANYLSEITNDPVAWKLMAEIAETYDKNMNKAIDCYAKSYELDKVDTKTLLKSSFNNTKILE